jgi:hypothetical protein
MAIQCTITTSQGISLESAYINIQQPQIIKDKTEDGNSYSLAGCAYVYASKEAYDTGKIPLEGFAVTCDLDLEINPLTQAYAVLSQNERLENVEECQP